jgi:hypothetical protein
MCSTSSECKCKPACWVVETPSESHYQLNMFSDQGDAIQTVELTRAEYIDLKEHLARSRAPPSRRDAAARRSTGETPLAPRGVLRAVQSRAPMRGETPHRRTDAREDG